MPKHIEDKEILAYFSKPETREKGFQLLVSKYKEPIYYHVRRILVDHEDANDVVQNVFIKIWKNLESFREDSKLYTWIYRISNNEALSFIKSSKSKYLVSLDEVSETFEDSMASDPLIKGDTIQRKLVQAINTLPARQKMVFNLRYFSNMNYQDMSEVLGVSVGTLKASYHLAVKKIEEFFLNN